MAGTKKRQMNVFISTAHVDLEIPAKHAHLARSWEQVCRLERLFWITYRPGIRPKRPFTLSRIVKNKSGFHWRFDSLYASLDNAVRAAMREAAI